MNESSQTQPVIEVRDLKRYFGHGRKRVEAVRGVSIAVGGGEIFGLIGPDGAGKTSIIQMLAGVLTAQAGSATVAGIDVIANPEKVKNHIGYMPQGLGANLYESLTVAENIDFFRDLRELPEEVYRKNRADLLRMTRLEPFVQRRAGNLSGGMRQKLALICTLLHLPDVILLDEPTTGVDPISRQEFWQIIRRLVEERRVTILLSTSYMDEAEQCDRIGLIHSGLIIEQGTPEGIKSKATGRYASIRCEPQAQALRVLHGRNDVTSIEAFGSEIHIRFDGELRAIQSDLAEHQIQVLDIAERDPGLEDVFLQLLGTSKQGAVQFFLGPASAVAVKVPVDIAHVTRRFGDFAAVDDVSLRIEKGEIFGLLGPNGAGKTTLIKMMCGLTGPSAGSIRVAGFDIRSEQEHVWSQIGYMSQRFSLYRDLTVNQNLRLYADLYGVETSFDDLAASLGLEPFQSRLAGDLPVGLRQRLSLLCAVLHRPPVLFLDEPTSGVDPPARRIFWDLIYSLSRESAVTVLVSTHYMDEANHCDRLGLMDQGRLVACGSPSALKQASEQRSGKLLAITAANFRKTLDVLLPYFPDAVLYGDGIHLRSLDLEADERRAESLLRRAGITEMKITRPALSMDEAFMDFIRTAEMVHA